MKASASPVNGAAAVCTTHPKPAARKAGTAQTGKPKVKAKPKPEVATYSYTDKAGQTLFQVVYNYQGKDFDQRRPDGKGWTWKMEGVKPVLYRLPEILLYDDAPIVIVDREADADALHEMVEMLVTTNPGGSLHGKWLPEYSDTIAGRDAFIVPGNHEAGRKWAQDVAASLKPKATSVRVVQLPGLPEGGTISDWFAVKGNGWIAWNESFDKAPEWCPPPAPTNPTQANTGTARVGGGDPGDGDDQQKEKETQAQALIRLAAVALLFHDAEQWPYATVPVGDHWETMKIRSTGFKRWLIRAFYRAHDKPPSATALNDALGVLEAEAVHDKPERPVAVRLAEWAGNIYLDLANPLWQVVEITPDGWRILPSAQAPVKFRRPRGLLALPTPVCGGQLSDLRHHLDIRNDRQWCLLVGGLVMAFHPRGPYPVLGFHGEQGSGKSTRVRILRSLIDPSTVPLRSEPKEPRDLMVAACNSWSVALDNLSHLPTWLSDALCRLATGGGFGTRELYTNDEEQLFNATRPVMLTGIEVVVTRSDLMDRTVLLECPTIPEAERKTEEELYAALEPARPGILGALLDAVVCALKNFPTIKLPPLPRMADFAKWVTAAEPALGWKPGTFLAAFHEAQAEANDVVLENWPIVDALCRLMEQEKHWEGKASELLVKLNELAGEKTARGDNWPKKPNILSGQLKRLATNLRKIGLFVSHGSSGRGKAKGRLIVIEADKSGDGSSPSSPSSPSPENPRCGDDLYPDGDDPRQRGDDPAQAKNGSENGTGDDGDDGDDDFPYSSTTPEEQAERYWED